MTSKVVISTLGEGGELKEVREDLEPKGQEEAIAVVPEVEKTAEPEPAKLEPAKEVEPAAEAKKPAEEKAVEEPKSGIQKRIDKLTAEKYRLMDESAKLRARLEALEGQPEETKETPAAETTGRPEEKNFETYEQYLEALAVWSSGQKFAELKAKEAEDQQKLEVKKVFDAYAAKTEEARKAHDDFDEVVGRDDIKIPQVVQLAIIQLDNGPEVAYHLGQHPELCEKLIGMRDLAAVMEVGRISTSLAAEPSASAEKTVPQKTGVASTAPKPIKPVGGAGATSTKLPLDDEGVTYRQFQRRREAGEA